VAITAHSGNSADLTASAVAAAPSWRWRRSALLLALFAQLVTVSALVGSSPPPRAWPSLLLAIAPAPAAGLAALTPRRYALPAAAATAALLVVGIAAAWSHTGLFFLPALAALAGAAVTLWRER